MVKAKTRRILAMILALAFACAGCASEPTAAETTAAVEAQTVPATETTAATEVIETTPEPLVVDTLYLSILLPGEYSRDMVHREVTEGGTAMEIFSMTMGEEQLELYRIYFGDSQTGNTFGILEVDGEAVPVTVSVCEYREDAFPDQETRERYYVLMDSLNLVLSAIREDQRFRNEEKVVVEKEEKQTSGWNFSLPEGMELEETEEDGRRRITFFGNVHDERHTLYFVVLGEEPLRTVLGTYDGKPVSVESCDLPVTEGWESTEVMELYRMMDSINDVIQTIMESEGFREELPDQQQ